MMIVLRGATLFVKKIAVYLFREEPVFYHAFPHDAIAYHIVFTIFLRMLSFFLS